MTITSGSGTATSSGDIVLQTATSALDAGTSGALVMSTGTARGGNAGSIFMTSGASTHTTTAAGRGGDIKYGFLNALCCHDDHLEIVRVILCKRCGGQRQGNGGGNGGRFKHRSIPSVEWVSHRIDAM